MFNWLKKIWNKGWYAREDGYKFDSRSRIERRAIKEETAKEYKAYDAPGVRADPHVEAMLNACLAGVAFGEVGDDGVLQIRKVVPKLRCANCLSPIGPHGGCTGTGTGSGCDGTVVYGTIEEEQQ